MKFFAALLLLAAVSTAQAETCVLQTGGEKEPSTDDSVGACISEFLTLGLFNEQTSKMTEVNRIVTTDTVNGVACVRNASKAQAAEKELRAQAADMKEKGQCSKVEILL